MTDLSVDDAYLMAYTQDDTDADSAAYHAADLAKVKLRTPEDYA